MIGGDIHGRRRAWRCTAASLLGAAVSVTGCSSSTTGEGSAPVTTLPAAALTPFTGGEAVTLRSLTGKPMLVNLWASWCTPCRTEMPELEQAHQRYGERVTFVGVTDDVNLDGARRVAADTGVTYPLYQDSTGAVQQALGVSNLPATAFVDREGRVVRVQLGRVTGDDVNRALDDLLAMTTSPSGTREPNGAAERRSP